MRKVLLSLGLVLAMTTLGAPVKVGDIVYEVTGPTTVKVMPDRESSASTNNYKGNITIPSSVTIDGKTYTVNEIGVRAFSSCYNLTGITMPNTIVRIDSNGINSCSKLTSLVVPPSVRVIESSGISSCGLTKLTLSEGLDSIGYQGVALLNSLKDTLFLPASLRAMAPGAVGFSHKMTAYSIPDANKNFKTVDGVIFSKDGKTLVAFPCYKDCPDGYTLPSGVSRIEPYAMSNLDRLTKFTFSYTTCDVADHAFYSSSKLTTIERATSIRSIGAAGFGSCMRLNEITLGYNLERIDSAGFASVGSSLPNNTSGMPQRAVINLTNCRALKHIGSHAFTSASIERIDIPAAVETIVDDAFTMAQYLQRIDVASANKDFVSINGVLYDRAMTTLLCVPSAFENQMFEFPNGVKHIGKNAFYGCRNMREVVLPEGLLSMGENAFYNCGLFRVSFPSTLTHLPMNCFAYSGLSSVVVPSTIKSMDGGVFSNCQSLVSAKLPDELPYVAPGTFFNDNILENVNIPAHAKVIGYNSFNNCYKIKKVVIPNEVREIEYRAFGCNFNPYNHGIIDTLILGRQLATIGSNAFVGQNYIVFIKSKNAVPPVVSEEGAWMTAVHNNARVDVPEGSLQAYKSAPIWNMFKSWGEFAAVNGVENSNPMKYRAADGAIEFQGEGTVEVYSISGLRIYSGPAARVEVPAKGVYIIRTAGSTAKVAL